jgi:hypothetical protein
MNDLLNSFGANVYSQNGEDGIIGELLRRMRIMNGPERWCVEFGAWDGVKFSNTFSLVQHGWRAVYIEGNGTKFKDLVATSMDNPSIVPLMAYVTAKQGDVSSLDALLQTTPLPRDFDLLSIDIDSNDLDVWESSTAFSPKIVIIEIDSSTPPGILRRHSSKRSGSTFSSTLKVAKSKGYTLVCHTGNMVFVRDDLVPHLGLPPAQLKNPNSLFQYDWFNRRPARSRFAQRTIATLCLLLGKAA